MLVKLISSLFLVTLLQPFTLGRPMLGISKTNPRALIFAKGFIEGLLEILPMDQG